MHSKVEVSAAALAAVAAAVAAATSVAAAAAPTVGAPRAAQPSVAPQSPATGGDDPAGARRDGKAPKRRRSERPLSVVGPLLFIMQYRGYVSTAAGSARRTAKALPPFLQDPCPGSYAVLAVRAPRPGLLWIGRLPRVLSINMHPAVARQKKRESKVRLAKKAEAGLEGIDDDEDLFEKDLLGPLIPKELFSAWPEGEEAARQTCSRFLVQALFGHGDGVVSGFPFFRSIDSPDLAKCWRDGLRSLVLQQELQFRTDAGEGFTLHYPFDERDSAEAAGALEFCTVFSRLCAVPGEPSAASPAMEWDAGLLTSEEYLGHRWAVYRDLVTEPSRRRIELALAADKRQRAREQKKKSKAKSKAKKKPSARRRQRRRRRTGDDDDEGEQEADGGDDDDGQASEAGSADKDDSEGDEAQTCGVPASSPSGRLALPPGDRAPPTQDLLPEPREPWVQYLLGMPYPDMSARAAAAREDAGLTGALRGSAKRQRTVGSGFAAALCRINERTKAAKEAKQATNAKARREKKQQRDQEARGGGGGLGGHDEGEMDIEEDGGGGLGGNAAPPMYLQPARPLMATAPLALQRDDSDAEELYPGEWNMGRSEPLPGLFQQL